MIQRVQRTGFLRVPLVACCLALAVWAAAGCSGAKGKNATLSGKVTYRNAPVTGGNIILHPEKGTSYPIPIKNDGTFSVSGVPTGSFKVTVETESIKNVGKGYDDKNIKVPPGTMRPEKDTSTLPIYVKIPPKYAQVNTTPLSWDLEKGKQEKDIELTD